MANRGRHRWRPPTTRTDDARMQSAREAVQASGTAEPATKRARFDLRNPSRLAEANDGRGDDDDDDDDDDLDLDLDLDEIGAKGTQTKRSGVQLDGYDTDSSDDNFDTRAQEREDEAAAGKTKAKGKEAKADDAGSDEDMFAESDATDAESDAGGSDTGRDGVSGAATKRKNRRAVDLIDATELAGESKTSRSGGHVTIGRGPVAHGPDGSDGPDSDDTDAADAAARAAPDPALDEELGAGAKRKNAPVLDAFNMSAEKAEGEFDAAGNFIRRTADPDAVHDSWLHGLSRKDVRKARAAQAQRLDELARAELDAGALSDSDAYGRLLQFLGRGETALEALARLGQRKKAATGRAGKRRGASASAAGLNTDSALVGRLVAAIQGVSEAADALLASGMTEVYDSPREVFQRLYTRETGETWSGETQLVDEGEEVGDAGFTAEGELVGRNSTMVTSTGADQWPVTQETSPRWKFRWMSGPAKDEVQGPFDASTMGSWALDGYFDSEDAVYFCALDKNNSDEKWVKGVKDFSRPPEGS